MAGCLAAFFVRRSSADSANAAPAVSRRGSGPARLIGSTAKVTRFAQRSVLPTFRNLLICRRFLNFRFDRSRQTGRGSVPVRARCERTEQLIVQALRTRALAASAGA